MLQHDRPSGSQQRHVLRTGFAVHHEVELGPFDLSSGLTPKKSKQHRHQQHTSGDTSCHRHFFNYWFQPLNRGVRYKCRFQEYIQHYKARKSSSLSWRWFLLTNNAQKRTFEKGFGNDRHFLRFGNDHRQATLLSITIKMEHARMTTVAL